MNVDIYDPWVDATLAAEEYRLDIIQEPRLGHYDAIILAVAHDCFREMGVELIRKYGKLRHILYDIKYLFPTESSDLRL